MSLRVRSALRLASALVVGIVFAGCLASSQRVQIRCVPREVKVYVDGQLLEGDAADGVVLRTDEPHKIFVKGEGYEPVLVVLEPVVDAEGNESLGPDEVCIDVVPVGMHRSLEIEMEHDVMEDGPTR